MQSGQSVVNKGLKIVCLRGQGHFHFGKGTANGRTDKFCVAICSATQGKSFTDGTEPIKSIKIEDNCATFGMFKFEIIFLLPHLCF